MTQTDKIKNRFSVSDRLKVLALFASCRILRRKEGTVKQFEDNQNALLNNPQWIRAVRGNRD